MFYSAPKLKETAVLNYGLFRKLFWQRDAPGGRLSIQWNDKRNAELVARVTALKAELLALHQPFESMEALLAAASRIFNAEAVP